MVKLLLDQDKINPNSGEFRKKWTPLFYAVHQGSKEIVKVLLQSDRVDVNCKDSIGCTPLFYAAEQESKEIVEILL